MEFKLIIKKLNKTLTPEEEIIFSKWYNESGIHKQYFDNVKTNYQKDPFNVDIEKGWLAIQNNLGASKQNKNYRKYPVAASIALLITISFVFNKKGQHLESPTVVNNNKDIEAGTDKATLTLEDGSNIALEKGQSYETENLNSNGSELVYQDTPGSDAISKPIVTYNYLTIPRGGQFFVKLSDGTQVWLNSETKIKYPVKFIDGETRQVELIYGEAYFNVSPSINHNGAKFKVLNKIQEVEVLGTEFNIKAYPDEKNIYTTLAEGKVAIDFGVNKETLSPNQQSIINTDNKKVVVSFVDVYNETSWKNGIFSFKSKSLKDIMKVLSRWYDTEVVFLNEELEEVKFIGVLSKNQNIEDILLTIKNTNFINAYEIHKNTIILK